MRISHTLCYLPVMAIFVDTIVWSGMLESCSVGYSFDLHKISLIEFLNAKCWSHPECSLSVLLPGQPSAKKEKPRLPHRILISKVQVLIGALVSVSQWLLLSKHVARCSNWRDPFCLGKFPLSRLKSCCSSTSASIVRIANPARALCVLETLFAGIARRCCLVTGTRIAADSSRASLFERSLHGARTRPQLTTIASGLRPKACWSQI